MIIDAIRKVFHSNRPFAVRTADGKVIDVPHRDFAAISPSGRTLIITTEGDTWQEIDVSVIVALETFSTDSGA